MAGKRIIWSARSTEQLRDILSFYKNSNKNSKYSNKIRKEITAKVELLRHQPYIGKTVDENNVRRIHILHYHVFYEITEQKIDVHDIWDGRRDPESIKYYKKNLLR